MEGDVESTLAAVRAFRALLKTVSRYLAYRIRSPASGMGSIPTNHGQVSDVSNSVEHGWEIKLTRAVYNAQETHCRVAEITHQTSQIIRSRCTQVPRVAVECLQFLPSSWYCHAAMPVARTGSVVMAALAGCSTIRRQAAALRPLG